MKGNRPLALSPFILGDPLRVGPEVAALPALLHALDLPQPSEPGCLPLAPGAVLVHAIGGGDGGLALRWVQLPHAPALAPHTEPTETAVVLTAPLHESGRALRLVSRLEAGLRDPSVLAAARAATTREALVRALAAVEETAGDRPLSASDALALLASTPGGLTQAEAARRLLACGPNRLEPVRRRSLLLRLLEQFWSFFAVLLCVGGAFAFLAGMPELGWAIFAVIVINGVFSFFQEYRAERAVEALQELLPHQITAVRDGRGADPGRAPEPRRRQADRAPASGWRRAGAGPVGVAWSARGSPGKGRA